MTRVGRWERLRKLGGLTTRLTGHGVRERLFGATDRLGAARDLADSLGRLKGAAMKVGQQAALLAQALDLPDDVQATLRELHDDAAPVDWFTIQTVLDDELDVPFDEAFASIERRPLGTASLAQAHAATLPGGDQVVVKVLHPGVLEGLETDLLALRALVRSGRLFGRRSEELDGVLAEVEARLREEVDYLLEAMNLNAFAEAFADDPRVVVPRPHVGLCTERVLVMDRVYGMPLDPFVATAPAEVQQRAWSSPIWYAP